MGQLCSSASSNRTFGKARISVSLRRPPAKTDPSCSMPRIACVRPSSMGVASEAKRSRKPAMPWRPSIEAASISPMVSSSIVHADCPAEELAPPSVPPKPPDSDARPERSPSWLSSLTSSPSPSLSSSSASMSRPPGSSSSDESPTRRQPSAPPPAPAAAAACSSASASASAVPKSSSSMPSKFGRARGVPAPPSKSPIHAPPSSPSARPTLTTDSGGNGAGAAASAPASLVRPRTESLASCTMLSRERLGLSGAMPTGTVLPDRNFAAEAPRLLRADMPRLKGKCTCGDMGGLKEMPRLVDTPRLQTDRECEEVML
mmetsp:Transcript_97156/g.279152  ORF Transcript_97156/g.279152 Transcript_97156/m.279152 type:complete len:317 (+) Transcript_97156:244-1194(+)